MPRNVVDIRESIGKDRTVIEAREVNVTEYKFPQNVTAMAFIDGKLAVACGCLVQIIELEA